MSQHRRIPRNNQKTRPPKPFSSPSFRTRPLRPSKSVQVLQRCKSEPILWTVGIVYGDENCKPEPDFVLLRPQTCTDIFASPYSFTSPSNHASPYISLSTSNPKTQIYKRDSKVVVNVTVEGSPGPVRTLIKLGASVEETIKLVVDRYSEEGRSPQLARNAASSFELHHSHFSLQSISKTDTIGDVGTRSFYLRKSSSGRSSEDDGGSLLSLSSAPEIVPVKERNPLQAHFVFMPSFIARNMSKIRRRMHKLWMVLGCNPGG